MDPRYDKAEALLAKIRPRFYADGLSEFDMLLRVRESARVQPFELGILGALLFLMVLFNDWEWGPWVYGVLVFVTWL